MMLYQRHCSERDINDLIATAPESDALLLDQVVRFSTRVKSIASPSARFIDAWAVEQAGKPSTPFVWRATTARRLIATNALKRVRQGAPILDAVRAEIDEHLALGVRGETRGGSLGQWLSSLPQADLGIVCAEAVNWTTALIETQHMLGDAATPADADAYFNVSGAKTTLRARRDFTIGEGADRVIVRVRSGVPGKTAGAGLRTDLFIHALAHNEFAVPRRFIGLWPDAGIALAVDGTLDNLRAGARDIVRVCETNRRHQLQEVA